MFKEQRQSLKLWEPGKFDAYKNAAAPMIVMLGHLELAMEVSDAGMETVESNNCRGVQKGWRCQWCVGCDVRGSENFLQRWMEAY